MKKKYLPFVFSTIMAFVGLSHDAFAVNLDKRAVRDVVMANINNADESDDDLQKNLMFVSCLLEKKDLPLSVIDFARCCGVAELGQCQELTLAVLDKNNEYAQSELQQVLAIESGTNIPDCPETNACSSDCNSTENYIALDATKTDCLGSVCVATDCFDPKGKHVPATCKKSDGTIFSYYQKCMREEQSDLNIPDCPATGSCSINDCKSDAVLRGLGAASADCYDGACIATACSDPSGNHTKKQCKKPDGTIFSYYSTCMGKGQNKNTDKCELTGHLKKDSCQCADDAGFVPNTKECKCYAGGRYDSENKVCVFDDAATILGKQGLKPNGLSAAEVAGQLPKTAMTADMTKLVSVKMPETELQKSLNEVNAQSDAQKAELQRRLQAGQLTQEDYNSAVNLLDANTESQRAEMTKKAQEKLQKEQQKSWEKTAKELNKIDASIKKEEAKAAEEAKKKLCEDTNGRWRPGRKDCECDDIYSFVDGQGCVLDQAKKQAQLEELKKKQEKLTEPKVDKKTERQTDKLLKDLQKQQEEAAEKAKQSLCEKAGRWNSTLKRCNCNDDLHKWDDAMGCVVDEEKMRKEAEKQAEKQRIEEEKARKEAERQAEKQRKADEKAKKQAEEDAYDKRVSDAMAEYGLSKSKAKQYIENQDEINALNGL